MSVFARKKKCAYQRSSGHVVTCRDSTASPRTLGVRVRCVGLGPPSPVGARQGSVGSRMVVYISRTPIRDSRVIRQGPSGPVGPYRVSTGFRRNPILAQLDPPGLDGSLDCLVSVRSFFDCKRELKTQRCGIPTEKYLRINALKQV